MHCDHCHREFTRVAPFFTHLRLSGHARPLVVACDELATNDATLVLSTYNCTTCNHFCTSTVELEEHLAYVDKSNCFQLSAQQFQISLEDRRSSERRRDESIDDESTAGHQSSSLRPTDRSTVRQSDELTPSVSTDETPPATSAVNSPSAVASDVCQRGIVEQSPDALAVQSQFPYECTECRRQYVTLRLLNKHRRNVHHINVGTATLHDQLKTGATNTSRNKSAAKSHRVNTTRKSRKQEVFACMLCDFCTRSRPDLTQHGRDAHCHSNVVPRVTEKDKFMFHCKRCPFSARQKWRMQQHDDETHSGPVTTVADHDDRCLIDGQPRGRYSYLVPGSEQRIPFQLHPPPPPPPVRPMANIFHCKLCAFTVRSKSVMAQHRRSKHGMVTAPEKNMPKSIATITVGERSPQQQIDRSPELPAVLPQTITATHHNPISDFTRTTSSEMEYHELTVHPVSTTLSNIMHQQQVTVADLDITSGQMQQPSMTMSDAEYLTDAAVIWETAATGGKPSATCGKPSATGGKPSATSGESSATPNTICEETFATCKENRLDVLAAETSMEWSRSALSDSAYGWEWAMKRKNSSPLSPLAQRELRHIGTPIIHGAILKCTKCGYETPSEHMLKLHKRTSHASYGMRTGHGAKDVHDNVTASGESTDSIEIAGPGRYPLQYEARWLPFGCSMCSFRSRHEAFVVNHEKGAHGVEKVQCVEEEPPIAIIVDDNVEEPSTSATDDWSKGVATVFAVQAPKRDLLAVLMMESMTVLNECSDDMAVYDEIQHEDDDFNDEPSPIPALSNQSYISQAQPGESMSPTVLPSEYFDNPTMSSHHSSPVLPSISRSECKSTSTSDLNIYTCDKCAFLVNRLPYLIRHMEQKHGQSDVHECDVCDAAFVTSQHLVMHKKIVHL